jgi:hypothetical protein
MLTRARTALSSKATAYTLVISVRVLLARLLAAVPCRSIRTGTFAAVPVLVAWAAARLASRIEHLALVVAHAALLITLRPLLNDLNLLDPRSWYTWLASLCEQGIADKL